MRKTALQAAGIGVSIAVGALLSGPLLATGIAAGGWAVAGGLAGSLAIDFIAGAGVSFGQELAYKKFGLE